MTEMPIGPFYRKGRMEKRALGFPTNRIIREELPRYTDPKEFLSNLRSLWEFQTFPGGAQYAVTQKDWDTVMTAVITKWPEAKAIIPSFPWLGSTGQRRAVELNLPDLPSGGVK